MKHVAASAGPADPGGAVEVGQAHRAALGEEDLAGAGGDEGERVEAHRRGVRVQQLLPHLVVVVGIGAGGMMVDVIVVDVEGAGEAEEPRGEAAEEGEQVQQQPWHPRVPHRREPHPI